MTSIKRVVDLAIKFSNETYEHGLISAAKKTYRKVLRKNMVPVTDYNVWMAKFDTLRESDVEEIKKDIASFEQKTLISVVMPVYNTDIGYLRKAIDSVIHQIYPYWELCIADDASPNPEVKKVLREYTEKDKRIKVVNCKCKLNTNLIKKHYQ